MIKLKRNILRNELKKIFIASFYVVKMEYIITNDKYCTLLNANLF